MANSMVCLKDFEDYAYQHLPKNLVEFLRSGAETCETVAENSAAFKRYRIRPRFLKDVSKIDTSVTIQNHNLAVPFGIAPNGFQKAYHPDGEIAMVKAAAAMGAIMIVSHYSNTSIEDIIAAAPSANVWMQIYQFNDTNIMNNIILRAEKSGCKALVLTVDVPVLGNRHCAIKYPLVVPEHIKLPNIVSPNFLKGLDVDGKYFNQSMTWKYIENVKKLTKLPIIIKGLLTAEDALEAVKYGVDGIIVSNHGGRQLNFAPATIDVLSEIVQVVAEHCEVYLDSGIRSGTDILKAIALGAKAVFIGRPSAWGLVYQGEAGVLKVLQILKKELDLSMALSGCADIKDIGPALIKKENYCNCKL